MKRENLNDKLNKDDDEADDKMIEPKFGLSGKLAEEANMTTKGNLIIM